MTTLTIRRPAPRSATTGLRARIATWVVGCIARRKMRADLAKLDDMLLEDIGLSRVTAQIEAEKPFWRA